MVTKRQKDCKNRHSRLSVWLSLSINSMSYKEDEQFTSCHCFFAFNYLPVLSAVAEYWCNSFYRLFSTLTLIVSLSFPVCICKQPCPLPVFLLGRLSPEHLKVTVGSWTGENCNLQILSNNDSGQKTHFPQISEPLLVIEVSFPTIRKTFFFFLAWKLLPGVWYEELCPVECSEYCTTCNKIRRADNTSVNGVVYALQQISIFHITSIEIFCIDSALIIPGVYEPWKSWDCSFAEQPICFSNDAWNIDISSASSSSRRNTAEEIHLHFSKTYMGSFFPKQIFDLDKGTMPEVKEHQAFRNQMNYEVWSYADTKSYNPFINGASFTSGRLFCTLLPSLASITRLFWSLLVLNINDLIFILYLCLFVH